MFGSAVYVTLLLGGVLYLGSQIAWVALFPIPLTVALSLALYPPMRRAGTYVAAASGRLSDEIRQSLDGAATIKSFTIEDDEADRVFALSRDYERISDEAAKVTSRLPIYLEGAVLAATTLMFGVSSEFGAKLGCQTLSFTYPNARRPALNSLSFDIPAGRATAIVGLSGSGKTTLVKLLMRFYEPQQGRITFDGSDIRHIPVHDLRSAISVVSQDPFLFNRTVADNIRVGDQDATMEDIVQVAGLARAAEFIERLPHGYDTMIGPSGVALSGGERQRIAIARALLKNAKVVVFDEATASLDSNTEIDLREAIRPLLAGRTVVLIAHRLSAIKDADLIIVLEDGRVIEQGTHDELLAAEARYAGLWATQLGDRPKAPRKRPPRA
jgi:ABC-type multidrug transport system fused ATPase/permease subunit